MLKAAYEDIGNFQEKSRTPADAPRGPAGSDAAASLKNILFFLSLIFRYPRETVYAELGRLLPVFRDFFEAYAGNMPQLPQVEALQAEYIRLFVNGLGRVPAVPYASFHLDGGVLMGPSYHRLREMMGRAGFELDESAGELEDHLAVVLEFGSVLAGGLMEARASERGGADALLDMLGEVTFQYLRPMAKPILNGISGASAGDFYTSAARALLNFILDAEALYSQIFGVSAAEE